MAEYRKIKGTPRKEALSMEQIMPMYIRALKLSSGWNTQRVFAAWDAVSGAAAFTLRRFYRDGKLYVTVSSSMLRSQLEFQKRSLVLSINDFLRKDDLFLKDYEPVGFVREIVLK